MGNSILSMESDKRIRNMLCLHNVFRRVPDAVFLNPDSKLWNDYTAAVLAVKNDRDINMDYQWGAVIGVKSKTGGNYSISADSFPGEKRPENPRLEEAYNMIMLRPCIRDMEKDTDIFRNAVKEYPLLDKKEALYKACKEIYVSIDRDIYFFMDAVDRHYDTCYVQDANKLAVNTKKNDAKYRKALDYLSFIEKRGLSGMRKKIFEQEFNAYLTVIRMNRELQLSSHRDKEGNKVQFRDYKGMDVTWADNRYPSDNTVRTEFFKGMEKLLYEAMGQESVKDGLLARRYEALADMVDALPKEDKEKLLSIHTSDIMYGFRYARWKEEKERTSTKNKPVMRPDLGRSERAARKKKEEAQALSL